MMLLQQRKHKSLDEYGGGAKTRLQHQSTVECDNFNYSNEQPVDVLKEESPTLDHGEDLEHYCVHHRMERLAAADRQTCFPDEPSANRENELERHHANRRRTLMYLRYALRTYLYVIQGVLYKFLHETTIKSEQITLKNLLEQISSRSSVLQY